MLVTDERPKRRRRGLAVMSLAKASERMGVSQIRAYQLEKAALKKLRNHPLLQELAVELGIRI